LDLGGYGVKPMKKQNLIKGTYYGNTAEDCRHIIQSYLGHSGFGALIEEHPNNYEALGCFEDWWNEYISDGEDAFIEEVQADGVKDSLTYTCEVCLKSHSNEFSRTCEKCDFNRESEGLSRKGQNRYKVTRKFAYVGGATVLAPNLEAAMSQADKIDLSEFRYWGDWYDSEKTYVSSVAMISPFFQGTKK
jgi:hypothetical protein